MAGLLTALLMLVTSAAAWAGLGWLIQNVPPTRELAVPAAYVFAFTALTGTGALLVWVVWRPAGASPARYLSHSMLFALIALFAVWLQSLRVLTPVVAALLLGLYAFLELAVLFGTRGAVELFPPQRR